ncbi:hypothetical protein SAMN05428985_11043 [Nocardioides sp. YR527]|uniref:hypothetical protein n=1 Tax=Nocardioides sp. YR527 TaxID=1881028 RepID=UPI00088A1441|nr:hypothetical protein [Nocardioides sp. YR527]SDL14563.1 hypothetical protein SAMN05428985_11043 [Nocardioides sp. YR527]
MSDTEPTAAELLKEDWHAPLAQFHAKEAAKYTAKAQALEGSGKTKAAARAWKVVERNLRLARKHEQA